MSNPQLRITGGPDGTCCPCPVQVDACTCNSNGCSFLCQSNIGGDGGLASLCGFSELGTPSTPPKKYRHQDLTSNGDAFTRCTIPTANCADIAACADGDLDFSFSGGIAGNVGIFTLSGSFVLVGSAGGLSTYAVTLECTRLWTIPPIHTDVITTLRVDTGGVGTPPFPINGQTCLMVTGTTPTIAAEIFGPESGVWAPVTSGCLTIGAPSRYKISDKWDIATQYTKEDCGIIETDHSGRAASAGPDCAALVPPAGTGFGCGDPVVCYGSAIGPLVVSSTTSGKYFATGCYVTSNPSQISSGEIDVDLSDEDLPVDAVARAVAEVGAVWSDCPDGGATQLTAFMTVPLPGQFTFSFRSVRVKGRMTALIVGHTYDVTFGWYDRTLGSSGPFLFAGATTLSVTATNPDQDTPYVDVPNEPGFETKAVTCAVVDVTGP